MIWNDEPVIQHIAFEISQADMAAEGRFWLAAGFQEVRAPEALGPGYAWYELDGTQVHLMTTEDPATPPTRGHVAVVAPDFEACLARLDQAGFDVREARPLWAARRAKATTPAGNVVELMESPPRPAANSER